MGRMLQMWYASPTNQQVILYTTWAVCHPPDQSAVDVDASLAVIT
jgi:hypothetical protein